MRELILINQNEAKLRNTCKLKPPPRLTTLLEQQLFTFHVGASGTVPGAAALAAVGAFPNLILSLFPDPDPDPNPDANPDPDTDPDTDTYLNQTLSLAPPSIL